MQLEQNNLNLESMYGSVTLDFIRSLPDLDVDNNRNHLMAALYALGFDLSKKIDTISGVLVRYRHSPMHVRNTTIYQGRLREGYRYKNIYKDHDILDVDARNPKSTKEFNVVVEAMQDKSKKVVTDLPFTIPNYTTSQGAEKQYNRSMVDKRKYKVINMQEDELNSYIGDEELYKSPFDD